MAILLVLPTGLASASDGVLEINQACATQTGCFSGDTAGFPVTIDGSAGRSYRLSSDLVVPDENTSGITVSAPSTSIDVSGFEIVRAACVGATTNCTPASGSGIGIGVSDQATVRGVSVRDGSIVGMGSSGVDLGDQGEASNLRVRWNRLEGIRARVSATIADNTAYQNGSYGIFGSGGSTITGNTVYQNGGDGILGGPGSRVQQNTVRSNSGVGLRLIDPQSAYRENVITSNAAGTVVGAGVNLGDNACDGTTTCP